MSTSSLWFAWYLLADVHSTLRPPPLTVAVGIGVDAYERQLFHAADQLQQARDAAADAGIELPDEVDLFPMPGPFPARGPMLWWRARGPVAHARASIRLLRQRLAHTLRDQVSRAGSKPQRSWFAPDDPGAHTRRRGSLNPRQRTVANYAAG